MNIPMTVQTRTGEKFVFTGGRWAWKGTEVRVGRPGVASAIMTALAEERYLSAKQLVMVTSMNVMAV